MHFKMVSSIHRDGHNTKQILFILKRRLNSDEDILESPKKVENLPKAERILPGHTLIKPSLGMLKSAAKYPQAGLSNLVYGNLNNLGITYGKTNERILYTGFRKSNEMLSALLKSILSSNGNAKVYILKDKPLPLNKDLIYSSDPSSDVSEPDYRRRRHKKSKSKYRKRDKYYNGDSSYSTEDTDTDSESSEYEKNPGNPYTIHKNRYKQNWMWNHVMTGDHMNVNPFAPELSKHGPSGVDLLFGRKWWYFNQDDFRPF
ncbi:unnamed protein product, partial [Iphiclides podalirius]